MKQKLFTLLVISLFLSCTWKKNKNAFIEALCIVGSSPVYEMPEMTSQVIASFHLGEQVKIMNRAKSKRRTNSQLVEIQATDGTAAWTLYENLLTNAVPAAILEDAVIYQHPEMNTQTDKKFHLAEFAAVTDQNESWVRIMGAGKKKEGWIPRECITTHPGDVNVAILAHSDLLDRNGVIITDKLADFLKHLPDNNAELAIKLQQLMDQEVADAIEQSIMEYEQEVYNEDIDIED